MTIEEANALCAGMLPGTLGIAFELLEPGRAVAYLDVTREVMAPNGFLHGGTITSLADTACGFGTFVTPGPHQTDFATVDLSCKFIGTALKGRVSCAATLVHGGRTTQVWDATVTRDDDRTIAIFRATQLILDRPPSR